MKTLWTRPASINTKHLYRFAPNPKANRSTDVDIDSVGDAIDHALQATGKEISTLTEEIKGETFTIKTKDEGRKGRLRFRNGAGKEYKSIGSLTKGEQVLFLGEIETTYDNSGQNNGEKTRHTWFKVAKKSDGKEGWVSAEYLDNNTVENKLTKPEPTPQPKPVQPIPLPEIDAEDVMPPAVDAVPDITHPVPLPEPEVPIPEVVKPIPFPEIDIDETEPEYIPFEPELLPEVELFPRVIPSQGENPAGESNEDETDAGESQEEEVEASKWKGVPYRYPEEVDAGESNEEEVDAGESNEEDIEAGEYQASVEEMRDVLVEKFPETGGWKEALGELNDDSIRLLTEWTEKETIQTKDGKKKHYLDFSDSDQTPWFNLDGNNWGGEHFTKVDLTWINDDSIQTHKGKIERFKERADKIAKLTPESFSVEKLGTNKGTESYLMVRMQKAFPSIIKTIKFESSEDYQNYRWRKQEKLIDKLETKLPLDLLVDIDRFDKFVSTEAAQSLMKLPDSAWDNYTLTMEDVKNFEKGMNNVFKNTDNPFHIETHKSNYYTKNGWKKNVFRRSDTEFEVDLQGVGWDPLFSTVEPFFSWLKDKI